MANAFNLTAQINLQGPTNLRQTVSRIKKELSGASNTNINLKIDPRAEKSIASATAKLKVMSSVIAKTSADARSLNASLSKLNSSMGAVKSTTSALNTSLKNTVKTTTALNKQTKQATNGFYALGKSAAYSFKQFAGTAVLGATVYKLGNAVRNSLGNFIDFDKQLVRVQQVTRSTASQVAGLSAAIDQAATTFGVSSKSLAGIAVTLSQAGFSAREAQNAMKALAQTELAPTFDSLERTTEGAIALMNQFSISSNDLGKALGSVNAVAAQFAVESGDIIAAIQRAGGVFASASKGVSTGTEALNEFIAVFTSVRATTRESAETIATGLRTIFTRIQRGSTIEALREVGVELQNAEGQFVGAYEAVRRLSEGLTKLDPRSVKFTGIVEELGGFRQVGKILPLINQFATAQEALNVAKRGQSSLDEASAKAQAALAVQIGQVKEQFDSLIRTVAGGSVFNGLIQGVLSLSKSLIGLAKYLSPILPILGLVAGAKIASGIGSFAKGFSGSFKEGGGAKGAGQGIGSAITGTADRDKSAVLSAAADATKGNTTALQNLTAAVKSLEAAIRTPGSAKPTGFARGGVVPGSGNRDTVPAMLTPGEFVVRKDAVKSLGTEKLHKMNKYNGGGGILEVDTIGAAVLGKKNSNQSGTSGLSGEAITVPYIADQLGQAKDVVLSVFKAAKKENKTYDLKKEIAAPELRKKIDSGIEKAAITSLGILSKVLKEEGLTGIATSSAANKGNFIRSLNEGVRGNLFEQALTGIQNEGKWSDNPNPQAPFDFIGPFNDKLGKLFPQIKDIKYKDAKATLQAASKENIAKKIGNQAIQGADPSSILDKVLKSAYDTLKNNTGGPKPWNSLLPKNLSKNQLGASREKAAKLSHIFKFSQPEAPKNQAYYVELADREEYAKGGYAKDTVPAMLTPGEFVINKQAAANIGSAQLNRMNKADKVQGFNKGGSVGFVQKFAVGGGVDPLGEQFMRSVEAMEAFTERANEAGMHVYDYQMALADEIVKTTKQIQQTERKNKSNLKGRAAVLGAKIQSDPSNVSQLQAARKEFIDTLSAIAPKAGKAIQQAATDITAGLQKGLSFDTIMENSQALADIMNQQITETEALNEAIERVSDNAGLAAENLKDLVGEKNISNKQFLDSREGQAFGRFGKMLPGLSRSISETKSGQSLIRNAELFSGKGLEQSLENTFGKLGARAGKFGNQLGGIINMLGGPAIALAGAFTLGADLIKGIGGAAVANSETGAAITGGLSGAGTGLATGSIVGMSLGGPVGAMIAGVGGAIIGGISGIIKSISTVRTNKALAALSLASEQASSSLRALSEAPEAFEDKIQNAFKDVAAQASSVSELGQLGQVGVDDWFSNFLNMTPFGSRNDEAREAYGPEMQKLMENVETLGKSVLSQVSTSSLNDVLDQARDAQTEEERTNIYANASQAKQAFVAIDAGRGATEEEKKKSEETFFLEKALSALNPEQRANKRALANQDPEEREKLIASGKKLEANTVMLQLAQESATRASRELAVAMENQVDIYRRVEAYIQRFNDKLGELAKNFDVRTNALQGKNELASVNRTDEQVLGNLSAYSTDQVQAVADRTAQLAGGGDQANKMSNQIMGAKIIQDQLPKLLANAGGEKTSVDIINELEKTFEAAGVTMGDTLKQQLTDTLSSKLETGRQGVSREELANDPSLLANLSKINEAALKAGIAIQKAYNDAVDKTISITNEMNQAYTQQVEHLAKAAKTIADSESNLANALGQTRSLEEMNASSDAYVQERFGNVTNNGELDPAQLMSIIRDNTGEEGGLVEAQAAVKAAQDALASAEGPDKQAAAAALLEAEDAYAALSQKVSDASSALEYLANDTTKAANALQKIQMQERIATSAMDLTRKAMTATGPELGQMTAAATAFTRLIDGSATGKEVSSLQFRQDAFAGFDQVKGLLGSRAGQVEADLQLKTLEKTVGGQKLLQAEIPGLDGKTFGQVLEDRRSGKTPESEYIDAYKQAVEKQAEASRSLAEAAALLRETFDQERREVLVETVESIPGITEDALGDTKPDPKEEDAPEDIKRFEVIWPQQQSDQFLDRLSDALAGGADLSQDTRNSEASETNTKDAIFGTITTAAAVTASILWGPKLVGKAGSLFSSTVGKLLPKAVTSFLPGLMARIGLTAATTGAATTGAAATTGVVATGATAAAGAAPVAAAAAPAAAGAAGLAGTLAMYTAALYGLYASVDVISTAYELLTDWEGKTEELMQRELTQVNEGYWTQVFSNLRNPGDAVASLWRGTNEWIDVATGGLLGWDTEFRAQKERVEAAISKSQQQLEENMKLKGASQISTTEQGAALTKDVFSGGELNLDQQKKVMDLARREEQLKLLEAEINAGRGNEKNRTVYSYDEEGNISGKREVDDTFTKRDQAEQQKKLLERDRANLFRSLDTEEKGAASNALSKIEQAQALERQQKIDMPITPPGSVGPQPEPVDTPVAETAYSQMTRLANAGLAQGSIFTHDIHVVGELVTIRDVLEKVNENLSKGGSNGNNLQRIAEESRINIPSMTEFLTGFSTKVDEFGSYVQQLSRINIPTIPSEITMRGNHVVDVRISGAAAFEGLEEKFNKMIKKQIGKKMEKIWNQTKGMAGEPGVLDAELE